MLLHAFCRQISTVEFEEQRVTSSQKAMAELLEILLTDQNITEKDRRKKLKQVQRTCSFMFGQNMFAVDSQIHKY